MSPREIRWRATATARIERDRLLWRLHRRQWHRSDLTRALAADVLEPVLRTHIERQDWRGAQRLLVRTLQARPRLFVLEPKAALDLRHEVLKRWPGASGDAARRADRLLGGRYDLLGYRDLVFDGGHGRIDWHFDPVHRRRAPIAFWSEVPYLDPSVGDHKIIWELNRHQHWLVLGRALWLTRDRRYGWAIASQLESWLRENPPLTGVNWASALELGFRSLSWVWALHFLLADTDAGSAGRDEHPWLVDLLLGLDAQLNQVERNLSYYFSPNTHLTGEALALYVAGLSLPELSSSGRWAETGRRILIAEIDRQIGADGGHAERSTHYHRYTLDFYLLALLMAERSGDTEAISRFTDAAGRAADFARAIADDNGRIPLLGDDDGGMLTPIAGRPCEDIRDSLALAAVLLGRPDLAPWGLTEEVFWLAARPALDLEPFIDAQRANVLPTSSRVLMDTGYVVLRDGSGSHLVFDVGPHGYLNGGHAHADALAVTLTVSGRPLLIDPGTSTYTMDPALRDRLRRTANHNAVTVDGRSSSVPSGPFHWHSRTDAQPGAVRQNPRFDWAEGWHDGFPGNRHRRSILRSPARGWLILDEVLGRGRHTVDVHWHFDPSWMVSADRPGIVQAVAFDNGKTAWLVHDAGETSLTHGDDRSGLGWCAPAYGTLIPTWTARVSREGLVPLAVVTWIADSSQAPVLSRLPADSDAGGHPAIAVNVHQDSVDWATVLRPGEPADRETRGCQAGDFHTDARLLHYGAAGGRLRLLAACDARHLLALRDSWLSITADEPLEDVCVDVLEGRLDLWSSAPVSRLRLQGGLVASGATVRLNGRELPEYARERADLVVAFGSDWGEPGVIVPCAVSPVSQI